MRRNVVATIGVVAALLIGVGLVGVSGAQAGSTSVLPRTGHYEGRDTGHRHIRFYYDSHGQVINFRVEHTAFPPATVQGDKWHHTCHNNHCTRAQWVSDTTVNGFWNISHAGGDVSFYAHWLSH